MSNYVAGTVVATRVKPTKNPDYYSVGFRVGETWYNTCTMYPDNIKQGDQIEFSYTEDEKYGLQVNSKSIKKNKQQPKSVVRATKSSESVPQSTSEQSTPKNALMSGNDIMSVLLTIQKDLHALRSSLDHVGDQGGFSKPQATKKPLVAEVEGGDEELNDSLDDVVF